jgi:hypothetical protein
VAAPEGTQVELGPEEHNEESHQESPPSRTTERRRSMTNRAVLPAADTPDGRNGRKRCTARPGACSEIRRQLMAGCARDCSRRKPGLKHRRDLEFEVSDTPAEPATPGVPNPTRGSFFEQRKRLEHGAQPAFLRLRHWPTPRRATLGALRWILMLQPERPDLRSPAASAEGLLTGNAPCRASPTGPPPEAGCRPSRQRSEDVVDCFDEALTCRADCARANHIPSALVQSVPRPDQRRGRPRHPAYDRHGADGRVEDSVLDRRWADDR